MAHDPVMSDEIVPPHMHGFDPINQQSALQLVQGFTALAARHIDVVNSSFFLDSDSIAELIKAQRFNNPFDGFHFMYGLETNNQIVLLIHRVRMTEDSPEGQKYQYLPQYSSRHKSPGKIDVFEYALIPVNVGGEAQLQRIDINSQKYRSLRLAFENKFGSDNQVVEYIVSAKTLIKNLPGYIDWRPITFNKGEMITGFFIGWGILELIARSRTFRKTGVKLLIGYGSLTLDPDSAKCLHLIAITANNKNESIEDFQAEIWTTQDQTKASVMYSENLPFFPTEVPDLTADGSFKPTLGSSCSYKINDKVG